MYDYIGLFIEHLNTITFEFFEDGSHGIDDNIKSIQKILKKMFPNSKSKVWSKDDITYLKIMFQL